MTTEILSVIFKILVNPRQLGPIEGIGTQNSCPLNFLVTTK